MRILRSLRASGVPPIGFPLATRPADPAGLRTDGRPPSALDRRRVRGAGPGHRPARSRGPLGDLDDADGLLAGADPRGLRHRRDHVLRAAPSPATARARRSPSSTPIPTRTSPRTSRRSTPNTAWPARRRSPWTTWAHRRPTRAGRGDRARRRMGARHRARRQHRPGRGVVGLRPGPLQRGQLRQQPPGRRRGLDELGRERVRRARRTMTPCSRRPRATPT